MTTKPTKKKKRAAASASRSRRSLPEANNLLVQAVLSGKYKVPSLPNVEGQTMAKMFHFLRWAKKLYPGQALAGYYIYVAIENLHKNLPKQNLEAIVTLRKTLKRISFKRYVLSQKEKCSFFGNRDNIGYRLLVNDEDRVVNDVLVRRERVVSQIRGTQLAVNTIQDPKSLRAPIAAALKETTQWLQKVTALEPQPLDLTELRILLHSSKELGGQTEKATGS